MGCEQDCNHLSGLRYASCMFRCALGGIRPTRGGTLETTAGMQNFAAPSGDPDFGDLLVALDNEMAANDGVLSRRSIEKALDRLQKSGESVKIAELKPHVKQFMDTEASELRKSRMSINQMLKKKRE